MARTLTRACRRPVDLAVRYGGEEFALLLPQTDASGAWHVALDVLAGVAALALPHADSATAATLKVDVDGRDVSAAFAVRADGRITGVVTGLTVGTNVVSASATGASAAKLTLTNFSRGGSMLSGTQTLPFFCATPLPQSATANHRMGELCEFIKCARLLIPAA